METDVESGESAAVETPGKARTPRRERGAAPDGERGGPSGPEPTRYGDWERKGIAKDF